MRYRLLATALLWPLAAAAAPPAAPSVAAPAVTETSFVTADGARTLQQSVEIAAPLPLLWRAFADADIFRRWNAPVAAIDLRVGGSLEASYVAGRALGHPDNIRHRLITFLPERLLVFQNVQAPADLPGAAAFQRTVTVIEYLPLASGRTRVQLSSTGWGNDAAADRLYAYFRSANAGVLQKLKTVFEATAAAP